MSGTLHLLVATPDRVLVDEGAVASVRAEDESGCFGILPGHTEFLTVLTPSVLHWRTTEGRLGHCAVEGGVLTVSDGRTVSIACRRGEVGDDLAALAARIRRRRDEESDADRRTRVDAMRLHALAVRRLVRAFRRDGGEAGPATPFETDAGGAP